MDFKLPRLIPRTWLGPTRDKATQGDHRHTVGDIKSGYISQPLFNGEAPVDIDAFMALLEEYGLDASDFVSSGGGGGDGHTHYRDEFYMDTTSLPDGDEETADPIVPAPGFRIFKISPDRACRVRLYPTEAKALADLARPIGTDVDIAEDHGLLFEFVCDGAISYVLSPAVDLHVANPAAADYLLWYNIQNLSGSSSVVHIDFDYVPIESEAP